MDISAIWCKLEGCYMFLTLVLTLWHLIHLILHKWSLFLRRCYCSVMYSLKLAPYCRPWRFLAPYNRSRHSSPFLLPLTSPLVHSFYNNSNESFTLVPQPFLGNIINEDAFGTIPYLPCTVYRKFWYGTVHCQKIKLTLSM